MVRINPGRINIVKKSVLPKTTYRLNAIFKIPMAFFTKIEQTTLKFVRNHRRPQIAAAVSRKNKAGGRMLPDLRPCYKLQ